MPRLTHQEEIELARRVVLGDDSAWEKLHSAFIGSISGFFSVRTSDPDEADSLANYCMWRAYRLLRENRYNTEYRFYTFLRMVSRSILSEFFKAQSRRHPVESISEFVSRIPSRNPESSDEEIMDLFIKPALPPPEDRLDILRELLELVFACGAKPHQIIAFGFVKLLGWVPRDMVKHVTMMKKSGELGDRFCQDYYLEAEVLLSLQEFKQTVFARFYEKLGKRVSQVYREREYEKLSEFMDEIVWNIPYELFFNEQDRAASISDWCNKVAKRTRNVIAGGELSRTRAAARPEGEARMIQ